MLGSKCNSNDSKFILDVCCGPKMMHFNKHQSNTVYCDLRKEIAGYHKRKPTRTVDPNIITDFRKLPFKDRSFKLIFFDPPHLVTNSIFDMVLNYGALDKDTWFYDIRNGFDECWRVLQDYGVIIFKWNEYSIKRKEILRAVKQKPLIGHSIYSRVPTTWFTFIKIPKIDNVYV